MLNNEQRGWATKKKEKYIYILKGGEIFHTYFFLCII